MTSPRQKKKKLALLKLKEKKELAALEAEKSKEPVAKPAAQAVESAKKDVGELVAKLKRASNKNVTDNNTSNDTKDPVTAETVVPSEKEVKEEKKEA